LRRALAGWESLFVGKNITIHLVHNLMSEGRTPKDVDAALQRRFAKHRRDCEIAHEDAFTAKLDQINSASKLKKVVSPEECVLVDFLVERSQDFFGKYVAYCVREKVCGLG
jgi:pyruvate/oxaloacetate carboxyltransferase